ncbi:ParB/RepB/Spo0J family partition protein [Nocardiopsis sp. NPDC057823]|uniref:ParB/RepB/Spo0J family partition protein n=1 Tax=Nocardiopsis sp. NPDC057823 TaxID=3346256 RepID=UPI00366BFBEA
MSTRERRSAAPDPVLARLPVETARVALLRDARSPRLDGTDPARVARLAEIVDELPPIVVQRPAMRVVDGMHRLQAARSRGRASIRVRYFDGSDEDAYILAVRLNVSHGLPLPMRDRLAALSRVLQAFPHWSDRRIAATCGVSPGTVAARRRRSGDERLHVNMRIGSDGRRQPRSAAAGRQAAAEFMRHNPEASLRVVARHAGISVGTALDVRRKAAHGPTCPDPGGDRPEPDAAAAVLRDAAARVEQLARDPSLWGSEHGRAVLRLASATLGLTKRSEELADGMPDHARRALHDVARACALVWNRCGDRVGGAGAAAPPPGVPDRPHRPPEEENGEP